LFKQKTAYEMRTDWSSDVCSSDLFWVTVGAAAKEPKGVIPDLYTIYGNDAFWLFGGGTHGHPKGSRAGARANRVATEAVAAGKRSDERRERNVWSSRGLA